MRAMLRIALPAIVAIAFPGCDLEEMTAGSARFKEEFRHTYELTSGGRLSVESLNGSIEIAGWNKEEVEITGEKYASSQELLDALEVDIVATGDLLQARAVKPSGRHGNMGVRFVIHAPRTVDLGGISSSNGGITISGIEGNARVKTSNGGIQISDLSGNIEASTSNGAVNLRDTGGSAILRTSNGSITAERVSGYFSAKTSNGKITATVSGEHEGGRPIEATSSNGAIELTLLEQPQSDVIVSTSNASITFHVPPGIRADLKASTSNAPVKTDLEVTVRGAQGKSRLEGSINGGGPLLNLESSNGMIQLLEREPEV